MNTGNLYTLLPQDGPDRDRSTLHRQMIRKRQVYDDDLEDWEFLNEVLELAGCILYPPPWGFIPYGRLKPTPVLPNSPLFYPEPFTADDIEEAVELINLANGENYNDTTTSTGFRLGRSLIGSHH